MDVADRADAEGLRRIERRGGDEHGGEADQRVEGGDELRHRRHRDAPRDDGAGAAAGGERHDEQRPAERIRRRRAEERGEHGNRHAHHAELIAPPARLRMRQAAQRQDEEHAGDEIEEGGEAGAHWRISLERGLERGNQWRQVFPNRVATQRQRLIEYSSHELIGGAWR